MIIKLSPVFISDEPLVMSVSGNAITINGEVFDFSPLENGYTLTNDNIDSKWFNDNEVTSMSEDGVLTLFIRFPIPENAGESMTFPKPIIIEEGDVILPYEVIKVEEIPLPELPPFPFLEELINENQLQQLSEESVSE